ncbi:hypothetical protein PVK06_028177 [Gossypium arboreum]|uniref:Uncharacterized protein n=1 Tax=Gossypium arboreum TaxID=29729 RepID=A0ABR0P491_GOSAR|nr:hypothetical protein PVK06_028177 [Gossypium arboreum]
MAPIQSIKSFNWVRRRNSHNVSNNLFWVSELSILMVGEGATTRVQKEVNVLQQEIVKVQGELSQIESRLDAKFEARLLGFKEEFRSELLGLFE